MLDYDVLGRLATDCLRQLCVSSMKRQTTRPKPTPSKQARKRSQYTDWDALEIADMTADERRRWRRANPGEEAKKLLEKKHGHA